MATGMARDMDIVLVIIMDMDMEAIGLMDMGIAMVSCMGWMVAMEAVMDMGITGEPATLVRYHSNFSSGQAQ